MPSEVIDGRLQHYSEQHTSEPSELLTKIDRDTHAEVLLPRMLSGHLQGRLLSMLSHMARPKAILEIGTYTGYSALSLAEGLTDKGVLHTIDVNEELESRVKQYFTENEELGKKITLHIGNALEIIPTINLAWDLVFIDADKQNYTAYYNMVLPRLNQGGVIIADNVLWSGKVADLTKTDKKTEALRKFNRMVQQDSRVENVLLPVRDGLLMVRKK
jgi:predicted O-methyltransferase YrrM